MHAPRRPILAVLLALSLAALSCAFPTGSTPPASEVPPAGDQPTTTPPEPPVELPTTAALPTEEPPTATASPTATVTPAAIPCDRAGFVSDVTVPDGTDFAPGATVTKTWRLRNDGSCTWTSGYALVFDHGDSMGAPASQQLTTGTVAPGQTIDVTVTLTAPAAEGTYRGYFQLRNPSGVVFGIGASADVAFWVEIEVIPPGITLVLHLTPMIAIVFPYSQGTGMTMPVDSCFDLDAGSGASCGSSGADFRYQIGGFPMDYEADAAHGTAFSGPRSSAPSKTDCQSASMSYSDRELDTGRYYCYQTSDGRYGYLHPTSLSMFSMEFDWRTYQ
jgi:hypothetical protein